MDNKRVHKHECHDCGKWFECPQTSRSNYCPACLGKRMARYNRLRDEAPEYEDVTKA